MAVHAHLPLRPSPCPLQVVDGYFVKYGASCVALLVYAMPIYMRDPRLRGSQDDITQDYVRAMRLLQNTSRCAWHTAASLLRVHVFSRLRRAWSIARAQCVPPASCTCHSGPEGADRM